MPIKLTQEQNNAIKASGTVLVSAAAGSGKTAVLVERVLTKVIRNDDPIDIDRLLIVTFTNAAASEMKERISREMYNAYSENPQAVRTIRQQILLDSAKICTIDSFCLDLVRDNFEIAGVNPDFKIASNETVDVLKNSAINSVISDLYNNEDADYLRLLDFFGDESGERNVTDAVYKIYDHVRSLPFPDEWMEKAENMYASPGKIGDTVWAENLFDTAKSYADSAFMQIDNVLIDLEKFEDLKMKYMPNINSVLSCISEIRGHLDGGDWDGVEHAANSFSAERLASVRTDDPARKFMREKVKSTIDYAKSVINDIGKLFSENEQAALANIKACAPLAHQLFKIFRLFSQKLDELKKERNILDFADIEYAALNMLVHKKDGKIEMTEYAKGIAGCYDEVMVDEYQDTNDLQDAIFYAASDEGKKLFTVGDVKQSIYRFRKANPINFLNRKQTYPVFDGKSGKSKVIMSGNFRSRPEICDFVNFTFRLLMSKKAAEMNYEKEDELISLGNFTDIDGDKVSFDIIKNTDSDPSEAEAKHIAGIIKEIMALDKGVSRGNAPCAKARYSDFTILLRSASAKSHKYAQTLEKAGIPVRAETKESLFDRPEIAYFVSVLRTADNPLRDVYVLSAALSPIFNITEDELAWLKSRRPESSVYELIKFGADNEYSSCKLFISTIGKIRIWAATLPSDKLIRKIYDTLGFFAVLCKNDADGSKKANLLALEKFAADFEKQDNNGLTAFLSYIDSIKQSGSTVPAAESYGDGGDAVSIMSIHHSKGLQTPVCILAGLSNKFNKDDSRANIVLSEKSGIGFKITDTKTNTRYSTVARDSISNEIECAAVAEELRILYVAMTRAIDRLYFVCCEKNIDGKLKKAAQHLESSFDSPDSTIDPTAIISSLSMAEWMYMVALLHKSGGHLRLLSGANINPIDNGKAIKIRVVDECEQIKTGMDSESKNVLPGDIEQAVTFLYPYDEICKMPAKYSVSELTKKSSDANMYKSVPGFLSQSGLTPAQKGTALHMFMQYADYNSAKSDASAELKRLLSQKYISEIQADSIDVGKIKEFFDSSLYDRISKSEKIMREERFLIEIPAKTVNPELDDEKYADETVAVQGVADCVFEEKGELVILDFKSDIVSDPQILIDRYKNQLLIYADAFTKIHGKRVSECIIYSFYLGKAVTIR